MLEVILLLLKGNFKRSKKLFLKHYHHYFNKKWVTNFFLPISKDLIKNQNDLKSLEVTKVVFLNTIILLGIFIAIFMKNV